MHSIKNRFMITVLVSAVFAVSLAFCSEAKKEKVATSAIVDANSGLRMRNLPGLIDSKVILLIEKGEEVIILDRNGPEETIEQKTGKWYKVKYNEKIGWVFSPLLKIVPSDNSN